MALSDNATMTMPVAPIYAQGGYNNCGNSMWGGDWGAWIILFLIFGAFGRGGFGGWGNESNCCAPATCADLQRGFDNQNVMNKLNGLENGLCDGFYAQNTNILNGFHGVDNAVCQLGYQTQQGFNAAEMSRAQQQAAMMQQLSAMQFANQQCCCDELAAIKDIKYTIAQEECTTRNLMQSNTRDIIDNQNSNARAILDAMNQNYIRSLENENQSLKLAASQSNQNAVLMAAMDANQAELIRRLGRDCPIATYVVPNPNCCYNPNGTMCA